MSTELTNPLQALLARATTTLPKETGATETYRKRFDATTSSRTIILADASGSMAYRVGGRRKIEILGDELAAVLVGALPTETLLFAFATGTRLVVDPALLPEPGGGTALHVALDHIATFRPARTLVISDGQPDSKDAALAAADRLSGRIDVLYIGPDDDHEAIAFMMALARRGGGSCVRHDLNRLGVALAPAIKRLLTA